MEICDDCWSKKEKSELVAISKVTRKGKTFTLPPGTAGIYYQGGEPEEVTLYQCPKCLIVSVK